MRLSQRDTFGQWEDLSLRKVTSRSWLAAGTPLVVDSQEEYEVEAILDIRIRYRKLLSLVRWKTYCMVQRMIPGLTPPTFM